MATEVTDPAKRKALLWKVATTMIMRFGPDWRDHMDSIEGADEILAPLGSIEDWATRAYEEMQLARLIGNNDLKHEKAYIFAELISAGAFK